MIVDTRNLPAGDRLECDICIIGAGPAGITLAREFAGAPFRVCLLESGGLEAERAAQDLNRGAVIGFPAVPLHASRERSLGGTSNLWTGYSRPLDPLDFAERDAVPDGAWPIGAAEMAPFYARAQPACELGAADYSAARWWQGAAILPNARHFAPAVFQVSPPTRFGALYRPALTAANNLTVLLHATATGLAPEPAGNAVRAVEIAAPEGKRLALAARYVVLAAGGIENARLLLDTAAQSAPLGDGFENVGRYFMDHGVLWKSAQVRFEPAADPLLPFLTYRMIDGVQVHGVLVPTVETLRREAMPNFNFAFEPASLADLSPGFAALRRIKIGLERGRRLQDAARPLLRALAGVPGMPGALYRKRSGAARLLYSTRFVCECPPDRESRVILGDERDALGMRRVRLDWRMPARYRNWFRRAHELLGEELSQAGLGTLRADAEIAGDPLAAIVEGYHHMGTTRMHRDKRRGVVDADCRVHGCANLFIAGSSVFPSYGHANPTLTIVALALRLADHLKRRLAADQTVRVEEAPRRAPAATE